MLKFLALTCVAMGYTASAQPPSVEAAAEGRWAQARLINKRTGESIQVKCYDSDPAQCTQFQYFEVNEAGRATALTRMLDNESIEQVFSMYRLPPRNKFVTSNKFFYVTSTQGTGFSFIPCTDCLDDETFFRWYLQAYKRGKYVSDFAHGAKVSGLVLGMPFVAGASAAGMVMMTTADLVLLPIRGVGKLVFAAISGPQSEFKRKHGVKMDPATISSDFSFRSDGNVYFGTSKWKRIRDQLAGLFPR